MDANVYPLSKTFQLVVDGEILKTGTAEEIRDALSVALARKIEWDVSYSSEA